MGLREVLIETKIALRQYARRPLFATLAIGTLAAGIGATTTIYSIIDSVLLAPLPYPDSDRLVRVGYPSDSDPSRLYSLSYPNFSDLEEGNRTFVSMAAGTLARFTLSRGDVPESRLGALVTSDFFNTLGIEPSLGRAFSREEFDAASRVVVLSDELWATMFFRDPEVLGRSLSMNGAPFTVVGVLPPDFVPPAALSQSSATFWLPLTHYPAEALDNRRNGFLSVVARLEPGATTATAQAEMARIAEQIRAALPDDFRDRAFALDDLLAQTVGRTAETLGPLLAAVVVLLVIACVNVANLLLVRASERRRELAIRGAMGASRGRIVRQLLLESGLLAVGGGVLGILFAALGTAVFVRLSPGDIPRIAEVSMDGTAILFATLITLATSLLFGLAPAWIATGGGKRRGPAAGLRHGDARGGDSRGARRVWDTLIAAEAGLALVLVLGAGLLINSFVRLNSVDSGLDLTDVYSMSVAYPGGAGTPEERGRFFEAVVERMGAIPGVQAAAGSSLLPLGGGSDYQAPVFVGFDIPPDAEGNPFSARYQRVTPGYFEVMDIGLERGEVIDATDRPGAPLVAMVNSSFAAAVFGNRDPIGARFELGDDGLAEGTFEIIGVVSDTRSYSLAERPTPEMYFAHSQVPGASLHVLVEAEPSAAAVLSSMRSALATVRSDAPAVRPRSMSELRSTSIAAPRFYASLLGGLALVALLLALVGVYGTLTYTFSRRAREMGLRKALGATGESLVRSMVLQGMRPVGVGIGVGVVVGLLATRTLESLVFDIAPNDPGTLIGTVTAILLTALLATVIPARRATRLDPMSVLRDD